MNNQWGGNCGDITFEQRKRDRKSCKVGMNYIKWVLLSSILTCRWCLLTLKLGICVDLLSCNYLDHSGGPRPAEWVVLILSRWDAAGGVNTECWWGPPLSRIMDDRTILTILISHNTFYILHSYSNSYRPEALQCILRDRRRNID